MSRWNPFLLLLLAASLAAGCGTPGIPGRRLRDAGSRTGLDPEDLGPGSP